MSRVLAPLGRRALEVTARHEYGPYRVLECPDPSGPAPRPGQFYMLSTVEHWGDEDSRPFLPRACSVLRARDGVLQFLLEAVGPGTGRLCELSEGERLWLLGPLGNGFTLPEPSRQPILIGGGVGIAPLLALADQLPDTISVLLGFRDAPHTEAAVLFTNPKIATDDGSAGHHGRVTDLLEVSTGVQIYACGPPLMLETVRQLCLDHSIPAQLALEAPMACGFGACFGCAVPTKDGYIRLCVDGPVVTADRLESALIPGSGH